MKTIIFALAINTFSATAGIDGDEIRTTGGNLCGSQSAPSCASFPVGQQCMSNGKYGTCTSSGKRDRAGNLICGCSTFN